jgi:hypothetical protein
MTDEHLAAMHKLLAEYHRKLAKAAVLDIVQQYHVDLAQRLRMRLPRYPGARRFWNALTNANSKKRWRPPGWSLG